MPLYLACLTGLSFPDVNLLSDDSSQNHCTNIYHSTWEAEERREQERQQ